ncbi:MAG: Hsp33 family molecular chaperone [Parvibaculum sp.]|nr:Hsp33 family molecular chaperone [Parvibaculum sp.]|tara:strand:- start:21 stop:1007 length:987 start_codon:yes stop_codon:yes gene_type:complete
MVPRVTIGDQPLTTENLHLDDIVVPFQIEGIGVRGRATRLSGLITDVMSRHAYPEPVSILLGEALTLVAMLGTALKFDGKLTLQTKTDGPVSMLVADFETPGNIRGYAHLDSARLDAALEKGIDAPTELLGTGYLALTIDQGADMDRYQGIVQLDARGLTEAAHEYFAQSEQIATRIRMAVGPLYERGESGEASKVTWRAGAVMVQHLAEDGGLTGHREPDDERHLTDEEKNWEHAAILLDSVTDTELLDPDVTADRLLFRLYHEDGVRVFSPAGVQFGCPCSRERIEGVLKTFGADDLDHMVENGRIEAKCEFCADQYEFDPAELRG